jgi:glycosyltransferase involved in cell wall biosynthesis
MNNNAHRTAESISSPKSRARPRLLFVCQTLPFPPDRGVNIRSYNVLRLLAENFDVTALCFYRKKSLTSAAKVQESVTELKRFADVEAFPIPQEHSAVRFAYDHARSIIRGRAYTYYAYASAPFYARAKDLLEARAFDIVHVDSLDLSYYLPLFSGLPVACTHHNVESEVLKRRALLEPLHIARYLNHQAKLLLREEQYWCRRVDLNIVVSGEDENLLERNVPGCRVVVIPNGVDTAVFKPCTTRQSGVVFVGSHDWFPNRDGMKYFATEVLPLLRSTLQSDVQITWVGRASEDVKQAYANEFGIEVTGYVPDVRPYLGRAACFIVPIRTGGGTRLKVLDAWAMGKAVVSTSVGCEGLAARDGENIFVRDDPGGFAEAVRTVLHNEEQRAALGAAGRRTAEQTYDWNIIGTAIKQAYLGILRADRTG